MGTITQINTNGTTHYIASTAYCYCETAAGIDAKVANVIGDNADNASSSEFTLIKGTTVHVKFKYTNTASDPTLNVGGTGAKPIMKYGTTPAEPLYYNSWREGAIVSFTYDGTNWVMNSGWDDNTTYSSRPEDRYSQLTSLVTCAEKYTWNHKADTSTTLSGYGITNAYTKSEVDTGLSDKAEILDIIVPISAGTGVLATVTDSRIKADYKVIGYNIIWDNPAAITSDIIVTPSNGSLTINGTCTSATVATFQIGKIMDEIDETVVLEEEEIMG